jgi:hypothetical protein
MPGNALPAPMCLLSWPVISGPFGSGASLTAASDIRQPDASPDHCTIHQLGHGRITLCRSDIHGWLHGTDHPSRGRKGRVGGGSETLPGVPSPTLTGAALRADPVAFAFWSIGSAAAQRISALNLNDNPLRHNIFRDSSTRSQQRV